MLGCTLGVKKSGLHIYLDNASIKVPPVHVAAVVDNLFQVLVDSQGELAQQSVAGHRGNRR